MQELFIPGGGMAAEEATVAQWLKQPGDAVLIGEIVATIETDKALIEVEAETEGVLGHHLFPEGAVLPVGTIIGRILAPGEADNPV